MLIMRKRWVAAGVVLALLGCTPETRQPVEVMALVQTGDAEGVPDGSWQARQVQLRTLRDVYAMDGLVATFRGGARIVVDPQDRLLKVPGLREDQIPAIFIQSDGDPPRASFIDKDGVLWPADFHTWNMVTAYFNLETAFDHFQKLGVPGETLQGLTVFYFPEFILTELSRNPQKDNAVYFSPVKALLVLPFDRLQEAPLAMNPWVIGHEYAHVVFHRLVYGDAAFPAALTQWSRQGLGATPQANALKAIDEGLADFLALGVSCKTAAGCNAKGGEESFDPAFGTVRDISAPTQCMDPSYQNALNTMRLEPFTTGGFHYRIGTVLASALFHAGETDAGREILQRSVISAYPALRAMLEANLETPQNFSLSSAADLLLVHTTSLELRTRLCSEFLGRLKLLPESLPNCPAQATPTAACP